MRRILLALFAFCGCRQVFGLESPLLDPDAGTADVQDDVAVERVCFASGNYLVCVPSNVPATMTLSDTAIDTSGTCAVSDPAHTDWCIVAARSVTIDGRVRATGSKALVVVAIDDLTITPNGTIDVGSRETSFVVGDGRGAGANSGDCTAGSEGAPANTGAGGGAGGTFGTAGGNGGAGSQGTVAGGMAAPVSSGPGGGNPAVDKLRGGCAGTAGGAGSSVKGAAGDGGGAAYLVAGKALTIDGMINASGGGGGGGQASKGGGGGGGSGGMIALHAGTTLMFMGEIFANGGGGGGGADNGASGSAGGVSTGYSSPAQGGNGGGTTTCVSAPGCGGNGSKGNEQGHVGGNDGTGAGGGGGGGGGGVIHVVSGQNLSGKVSPLVN